MELLGVMICFSHMALLRLAGLEIGSLLDAPVLEETGGHGRVRGESRCFKAGGAGSLGGGCLNTQPTLSSPEAEICWCKIVA